MPDAVALDIGSYTIKAIQGKPGKNFKVTKAIEVPNELGTAVAVDEASREKLAEIIKELFQSNNLPKRDVRLSLPETLVSTKVISIPPLSDAELASAIQWQAEQHIPIPFEELSLEYQVIYRPSHQEKDRQMIVLLVGARKSIIEKYLEVFLPAEIEPTILETHTLSLMRAVQFVDTDPITILVHVGATTTDMAIMHELQLRFVFTSNTAGQVLTRNIEVALEFDPKQAEQYKRSYGIDPDQLQGKIREIVMPTLRTFALDIQKATQFFESQNAPAVVKRIVLSGGTAQLPGLVQFLAEQLGMEVLIASPFATASGEVPQVNQPVYTVCAGLLMREK